MRLVAGIQFLLSFLCCRNWRKSYFSVWDRIDQASWDCWVCVMVSHCIMTGVLRWCWAGSAWGLVVLGKLWEKANGSGVQFYAVMRRVKGPLGICFPT